MADQGYENRQDFEMEIWPELRERWNTFLKFVFAGREADKELKQLLELPYVILNKARLSYVYDFNG